MRRAGWAVAREPDEAWPHFRGWRVNYETAAYALAGFLDLPPAVWSGTRPRHRPATGLPVRPPHREPGRPQDTAAEPEPQPPRGPQPGRPRREGRAKAP
jgi:hypothetical protein